MFTVFIMMVICYNIFNIYQNVHKKYYYTFLFYIIYSKNAQALIHKIAQIICEYKNSNKIHVPVHLQLKKCRKNMYEVYIKYNKKNLLKFIYGFYQNHY